MKQRPVCPRCGQPAFQFESPNGLKSRCEPCGLWSKGNRPLRDAEEHRARFELRRARCNAHAAFDRLWHEGHMDREEAYVRLAQELGMDRDACHMSLMDVETARRVPAAVKAIRVSLRGVMAS